MPPMVSPGGDCRVHLEFHPVEARQVHSNNEADGLVTTCAKTEAAVIAANKRQGGLRDAYPAQQESWLTSCVNVCAASFSPSTIVRYGNNWLARSCTVVRARMASAAV